MTLILALLREDHIIFASDRRHVTGELEARYINDHAWKTEKILGNTAMLGFAGDDFVEQVIAPLKRRGALEGESLREIANSISAGAREKYEQFGPNPPSFHLLLAGFRRENGKRLATVFTMTPATFLPLERCHDSNPGRHNFEIIGKDKHGALYALHTCAAHAQAVGAGVQLAYFTLKEVARYDPTVGGSPQICVIYPDRPLEDRSDDLEAHATWAGQVREQIRTLIVSPMTKPE